MNNPEPKCVDPVPFPPIANEHQNQTANDEKNDGDMQNENCVGQ